MKNKIKLNTYLVLMMLFILSACNESSSTTTATDSAVVGSWSFTYTSSGCIEKYNFNSDNTWSETALNESQTGTYTFNENTNSKGQNELSLSVLSDNGLPDCSGASTNGTGANGLKYVTFTDSNTMNWFNETTNTTADFVFTK